MQFGAAIALGAVVCAFHARAQAQENSGCSPDAGLRSDDAAVTAQAALDSESGSRLESENPEPDLSPAIPVSPGGQAEDQSVAAEHIPNQPSDSRIDGRRNSLSEADSYRLEGVAQARYVYQNASGGPWQGSFEPPFVRAGLVGRVGSVVDYQVSGAVSNGSPELFTAYAEIAPLRFLSIRAGQMRVPFSRESMTPEESLTFPERSLATKEFSYLRDIGVSARVHGLEERLELILGAYNGSGPNRGNDNLDPMLLVRVAGVPLGQSWGPDEGDLGRSRELSLSLGGSATVDYVPAPTAYGYLSGNAVPVRPLGDRDIDRDGRVDDVRIVQLAGDVALRFRGLAFDCELFQRRENWKALAFQPKSEPLQIQNQFRGWFAQLSYYVLDNRLQIAARASVARISPLTVGGRIRSEAVCSYPDGTASTCRLPYADARSELVAQIALHLSGLRIAGAFARSRWSSDSAIQPPSAIENQLTILTQWIL